MRRFQWKRGLNRLLAIASACWALTVCVVLSSDWPTPQAHDLGVALDFSKAQAIASETSSQSRIDLSAGLVPIPKGAVVGSPVQAATSVNFDAPEGVDCYDRMGRLVPYDAAKFGGTVTKCAPHEYEVPHGHRIGLPTHWERWHGRDILVLLAVAFVPVCLSFVLLHSLFWAFAGFKEQQPSG